MAKHRKAKQPGNSSAKRTPRTPKHGHHSTPPLILLSTAAAGLTTALVFGQATDNTADNAKVVLAADTAIGIGGRGDATSSNIPAKLQHHAQPTGYTYVGVNYPAGFDIDNSVAAGVPDLHDKLGTAGQSLEGNQKIVVVGYSEGALVAERERRNLATDAPTGVDSSNTSFVLIASANLPNGGIFARFPDLNIPFFVSSNGAAEPSDYTTTFVTNEYDPYADFPAYFNPLSLANTVAAIEYVHPDQYYDSVDYDPTADPASQNGNGLLVKTVGNTTYVFVPADHLPLLAPLRDAFASAGIAPYADPVLDAFEPLIRVGVDMGYTDRQNLDPGTATQFSFITPPAKIIEALAAVPGALAEGGNNLVTGYAAAIPGAAIPLKATASPLLAPVDTPSIDSTLAPAGEQKLPNTDTPTKLPTFGKGPLAPKKGPLPITKAKPGQALQNLTHPGASFAKAPDAEKAPPAASPSKGDSVAKHGPFKRAKGNTGNAA